MHLHKCSLNHLKAVLTLLTTKTNLRSYTFTRFFCSKDLTYECFIKPGFSISTLHCFKWIFFGIYDGRGRTSSLTCYVLQAMSYSIMDDVCIAMYFEVFANFIHDLLLFVDLISSSYDDIFLIYSHAVPVSAHLTAFRFTASICNFIIRVASTVIVRPVYIPKMQAFSLYG